ncbi:MAG: hypothetical protein H0X33_07680 [Taibaiella sp.]|nr:hypothetical protein [Taibaiella sp.]
MKNLLVLTGILLIANGCFKSSGIPYPAVTHNGTNIVAFKVNGKAVIVDGDARSWGEGSYGILFYDTDLVIASHSEHPHYRIDIEQAVKNYPTITGSYTFTFNYPNAASFSDYTNGTIPSGDNTFVCDSTHSGYVSVEYFTKSVLSGTFAFDAVNSTGNVVHITEGRFDLSQP